MPRWQHSGTSLDWLTLWKNAANEWGYSPTSLINGARFYLIIVDDFSKYTWLYPMASKSQTIDIFRSFKSLVENMLNPKIKADQSDGGGEFTSHWFRAFLSSNGISHRISCPYTPEQNGVTGPKC